MLISPGFVSHPNNQPAAIALYDILIHFRNSFIDILIWKLCVCQMISCHSFSNLCEPTHMHARTLAHTLSHPYTIAVIFHLESFNTFPSSNGPPKLDAISRHWVWMCRHKVCVCVCVAYIKVSERHYHHHHQHRHHLLCRCQPVSKMFNILYVL